MINVPENELFSAYLDGELTAAEQADVERLLAASPAARQLMDELRALSSTLQTLPAHKLGEDLSQQVLRLAEQRVLAGQTDSDPFLRDPVTLAGRWKSIARRFSQPRVWAWPAAAAAVAIVLAILNPERAGRLALGPAERHVVMAPMASPPADREPLAIGAAGDHVTVPAALAQGDRDKLAEQPAGESAPVARYKSSLDRPTAAAMPAASPAPVAPTPSTPKTSSADTATSLAVISEAAASTERKRGMGEQSLARPMKAAKQGPLPALNAAKEGFAWGGQMVSDGVLIVRCDVAPEALDQQVVQRVLDHQRVAKFDSIPTTDGVDHYRAGGAFVPAVKDEKGDRKDEKEKAGFPAKVALKPADKQNARAEKLVCLRAQATQVQLEAILEELRAQPQMVRSSSVAMVPAGDVEGLTQKSMLGRIAPEMKGKSGEAEVLRFGSAYGGGAASQAREPSQSMRSNVQNQATAAQSAGGRRDASQVQKMQPNLANMAESESTVNTAPDAATQRRMSRSAGQADQMPQKGVETTQAGGTRMGEMRNIPQELTDNARPTQERQREEMSRQTATGPATAPRQQSVETGQVAGMPGGPPPIEAKKQPAGADSVGRQPQEPVRYQVVFVLRAVESSVDADRIASEKAAKAETGEAKEAAAKAVNAKMSPPRVEAATKLPEPAKPAASVPPVPAPAK